MKKKYLAMSMLSAIAGTAHAQSSVTLYGSLDAGVTYTNNAVQGTSRGAVYQFASGSAQGDRWGLLGTEDLGGQLKAIFNLEGGFSTSNGALGQGGLLFGRQAYVGLSSGWGKLTLGRQYDFIGDTVVQYAFAAETPAGLLDWSLPYYAAGGALLDNRLIGDRTNNAIKYQSPKLGGLTLGVMYSLSGTPGSLVQGNATNVLLNYVQGSFSISASWFGLRNAVSYGNSNEYILGSGYDVGPVHLSGFVSDVEISGGNKPRAITYEASAIYKLTPAFLLGAGIDFQQRNNSLASANQLTLTADYLLSKRTDVYVVGALGHDHAFGAQVQAALGSPSSTDAQTALRVGLRTRF